VSVQGEAGRATGGVQAQGMPYGERLHAAAQHRLRRGVRTGGSIGLGATTHLSHSTRGVGGSPHECQIDVLEQ
jgi:hypothetical protein